MHMDPTQNNMFSDVVPYGVASNGEHNDILLNGNKNNNKKRIVISVIATLIVIIVSIVGFILFTFNGPQEAKRLFSDLRHYIEEGNGDTEDKSDIIYAILIRSSSNESIASYYDALTNKKNLFLESNSKLDEVMLSKYENTLNVLNNLINHKSVEDRLTSIYKNNGLEAAKTFFNDNIGCEQADGNIEALCDAERIYYDGIMSRFVTYYDNGCIKGELFDRACLDKKTNNDTQVTEIVNHAERVFNKVQDDVWYKQLSDEIKYLNDEISKELGNA